MINSSFLVSDVVVRALGWMLLHSLWQGTALALVVWLLLPRMATARQRYWLTYGGLLAVLATAAGTFGWIYADLSAAPAPVTAWSPGLSGVMMPVAEGMPAEAVRTSLSGWLEPYHPLIVGIWLLGFLFFAIRLAGGMWYLHRLRRRHNQPVREVWQNRLDYLAARLGLWRPVILLESALVRMPVALGFFKPLILLPVGMANRLSVEEVEAILAHELSHIARRDWVFNLVQAFIEAVFYFHPAVWWMAGVIRAERENACDDAAVALTGNRLAYAKTLVRLQDLARSMQTPALALGIEGTPALLRSRPQLLDRIKRILQQQQPSTSLMEKTIALVLFVALLALWTLRANTPPALTEGIRNIAASSVAWFDGSPQAGQLAPLAHDSIPKPKQRQRIVREDDNKSVELELENGQITRLKVDGQEIDPGNYADYRALTDEMLRDAAPPAPPAPPNAPFGVWTLPAPAPPMPPRAPSSRLRTETDDDGNTIIQLERNGKPVEIRVKDGIVWIDGKQVEEGETIDLPGGEGRYLFWNDGGNNFRIDGNRFRFIEPGGGIMVFPNPPTPPHFFFDGENFHFEGLSDSNFHFKGFNFYLDGLKDFPALGEEDLKRIYGDNLRQMKEQRKQLEEHLRLERQEMRRADKERLQAYREYEKALRHAERAQQRTLEELAKVQQGSENRARRAEQQAYQEYLWSESVSSALKKALLRDKLISDPDNFSLDLSGKDMRVNGKKQPEEIHRKYLELYRAKSGKELGKKDNFRIEVEN